MKENIRCLVRGIYHRIPLTHTKKQKLKDTIYTSLRPLIQHTEMYLVWAQTKSIPVHMTHDAMLSQSKYFDAKGPDMNSRTEVFLKIFHKKTINYLLASKNPIALYKDWRFIRLIRKSDLFDKEWYLLNYADVRASKSDAAMHYYFHGALEGRNPGPFFNSKGYLDANPDVKSRKMNPLVHYLRWGKREHRPLGVFHPTSKSNRKQEQSKVSSHDVSFCEETMDSFSEKHLDNSSLSTTGRVAVFASFSADGIIHPYIVHYLRGLRQVCDKIIFCSDNYFSNDETCKISPYVDYFLCNRHGEYDFGSYKRGIQRARELGFLQNANELLLCNDSCYGPIGGFSNLFSSMNEKDCDFWGLTANTEFGYHLQSYFLLFKRTVFTSDVFENFFGSVKAEDTVRDVVLNYEVRMTSIFASAGFRHECYINDNMAGVVDAKASDSNLTRLPELLIKSGCPLIKVKAFQHFDANRNGIERVLVNLSISSPEVYYNIMEHKNPQRFFASAGVLFSIIMPFHNRRHTIFDAIESVRSQTHQGFELIMIDDGSTDDAYLTVLENYKNEFQSGRFRLIRSETRIGVSAARNAGLNAARNAWIAYIDSDNQIKPYFLSTYATAIITYPKNYLFYSCFQLKSDGSVCGKRPFDRNQLLIGNFIDLGTFVHSRARFKRLGGFDTNLKRLVDWDLLIRYTEDSSPIQIKHPLMVYNDEQKDISRISVTESYDKAISYLRKKHGTKFIINTVIPTYNHEKYISSAIESALAQKGDFIHKIYICDDGSTDTTRFIAKKYIDRYPNIVIDICNDENAGISDTYRKCFEKAGEAGDLVAVLEGDDYWSSTQNLQRKLQFLKENDDAVMVFSKLDVLNTATNKTRHLKRQSALHAHLLSGEDFLRDTSNNLIANFSSCMFRAGVIRTLPDRLFEGRFNEIALAFYLERYGKLGFLDEVLSVYRQHPQSVWSGTDSDKRKQLKSAIEVREMCKDVANPIYHDAIQKIIDRKTIDLQWMD